MLVFIFVTFFELQQKPVGRAIRIVVVSPHNVAASVDAEVGGMRRLRIFGQRDKLRADRSKGA
jgi:hypothetical protein